MGMSSWTEIKNEVIHRKSGIEGTDEVDKKNVFRWFGHVEVRSRQLGKKTKVELAGMWQWR